MPGTRQGPEKRPAWMHPQDLVLLLFDMRLSVPDPDWSDDDEFHTAAKDLCWMHDLLEDGIKEDGSRVTAEDLRAEGFDDVVVDGVIALSQVDGEEKAVYLGRLQAAPTIVSLVKCIDRVCNLREGSVSFKDKRWARYVDETRKYIFPLVSRVPGTYGKWLEAQLLAAIQLRPVVEVK